MLVIKSMTTAGSDNASKSPNIVIDDNNLLNSSFGNLPSSTTFSGSFTLIESGGVKSSGSSPSTFNPNKSPA